MNISSISVFYCQSNDQKNETIQETLLTDELQQTTK